MEARPLVSSTMMAPLRSCGERSTTWSSLVSRVQRASLAALAGAAKQNASSTHTTTELRRPRSIDTSSHRYARSVSVQPDDPPEAGKLPTGRIARTARVGGLVTGQGLRWAGMRTANRVRGPERAAAAESKRAAALIRQVVAQLGQMRGAAMKVGQMISMLELDGLPEEERDELQRSLAALRDDVPPVRFKDLEKLMRQEFGGPLSDVFSEFDERAFAAASIGQVHRATTVDGADVAVKIQYPGVAEAVDTDLPNCTLLVPLVKRLAPGLDGKALAAEMRERIGEELDYELEAQNQRRIERLLRGHPFVRVPRIDTSLSTQRVLVSEYVDG